MKTLHTKGEWKLSSQITNDIVNKAEHKEETWFNFCIDLPDHLGALQSCNINEDEAIANAKLIAAAPDLLESLNDLVEKLSPYIYKLGVKKGFSELVALEAAKKAIRKATE